MKRLLAILPDAIARKEVLRAARAQRALRAWPEAVGNLLATKSAPERYDKGTVWVAVEGSAWAQELRMLAPAILGKLAEISGDPYLFKELRFGVRAVKKKAKDADQTRSRFPRRPDLEPLTIREIADRRIKKMQK
jgi:predicted nucleic acid-binding Zn ribbon protein